MSARADNGLLTAINPGTFDPVTLGHVDVIRRAAAIFDRVVVGVVRDPQHKRPLFSVEERVAFVEEALRDVPNAVVDVFGEFVVDFARKHDAKTMVGRCTRCGSGSPARPHREGDYALGRGLDSGARVVTTGVERMKTFASRTT